MSDINDILQGPNRAIRSVQESYLEGIKEGRALRKMVGAESVSLVAETEIAFCNRVDRLAGSEMHADFIRGVRDFWTHQLEKAMRGQL